MESILLQNNKLYLAENCIRSFTMPTFIPSIVFSAFGGLLTVLLYEKFIRKDCFLPYLYFGTTALLYSVANIFLIIFIHEEKEIDRLSVEHKIDVTHENALYGSLIISAVGLFFVNLACFRSLHELWIVCGYYLGKPFFTLSMFVLSCIPFCLTVIGNIVLIAESNKEEEMSAQVKIALILKMIGASCNVILILLYLGLLYTYYALNNEIATDERTVESPSKDKQRLVFLLFLVNLLVLIRYIYELYIVISVFEFGPTWDIYTYLVLVVADGILLLIVAYYVTNLTYKHVNVYNTARQHGHLTYKAIVHNKDEQYI
ncbi:MAG: hypothetical protein EXX96DRAFT_42246 [Benjaminiella poitrasii]|nr:MAG: hypothetical protein EXX96DRAFT_42246 [Benjaminiella poitrasii]